MPVALGSTTPMANAVATAGQRRFPRPRVSPTRWDARGWADSNHSVFSDYFGMNDLPFEAVATPSQLTTKRTAAREKIFNLAFTSYALLTRKWIYAFTGSGVPAVARPTPGTALKKRPHPGRQILYPAGPCNSMRSPGLLSLKAGPRLGAGPMESHPTPSWTGDR